MLLIQEATSQINGPNVEIKLGTSSIFSEYNYLTPMSFAVKRVIRDLTKIAKSHHPEYSLKPLDSDQLLTLHGNLRIQEGIYEGLIIHVRLYISTGFPYEAPKMYLGTNFPMSQTHHEHLYDSPEGISICTDLLSNFQQYFKETPMQYRSGWTPGTTLDLLMLSMVHFFSEPDLPPEKHPSPETIAQLFAEVQDYRCPDCGHETRSPHPALGEHHLVEAPPEPVSYEPICGITKESPRVNPELVLGYPIYEQEMIPELISYQAWKQPQMEKKTATGQTYRLWIPMYLNPDHASRIYPFLTEITAHQKYEDPARIRITDSAEWLLSWVHRLNKYMLTNTTPLTENFGLMYLRLLQTVKHLWEKYEQVSKDWSRQAGAFNRSSSYRQRSSISHLGVFHLIYMLSGIDYQTRTNQRLLWFEHLVRQVKWLARRRHDFRNQNMEGRIKKAFFDTQLSCQLYAFQYRLITDLWSKIPLDSKDPEILKTFLPEVWELRARALHLTNYFQFWKMAGIQFASCRLDAFNLLHLAVYESNRQRYTNIYLPKSEDYYYM